MNQNIKKIKKLHDLLRECNLSDLEKMLFIISIFLVINENKDVTEKKLL
jgi:hypothetical protein